MDWVALLEQHLSKFEAVVREAAPQVWGILLRQAAVEGAVRVALSLFAVVLAVAAIALGVRGGAAEFFDDNPLGFVWGLLALVSGVALVVAIGSLSATLTPLLNPEYWALRELMSSFK